MKKAFVHCWIAPGGALNVFKDIIQSEGFSDTDKIFTLFSGYRELQVGRRSISINTALPKCLNAIFKYFSYKRVRLLSSVFDYRNLIVLYPLWMKILSWKIKRFAPQKVIISSFAIAKNLKFCKEDYRGTFQAKTMLYLHSPMQYIRSSRKEYLNKLSGYKLIVFKKLIPYLQKWDKKYVHYDKIYANSNYTANLSEQIYGFGSRVVYPKINKDFFGVQLALVSQPYYVFVGRLVRFVRETDIVIELFNRLEKPLIIMGDGPDETYLKSIAKDNIIFVGWISDINEKIKIISQSKGLINLTKESFGIATVESLLMGIPVFGFGKGATSELVDSCSGSLVFDKQISDMVNSFEAFDMSNWDKLFIRKQIKKKLKKYPWEFK